MFQNITSYLGECRAVCVCVCVLTCACVDGGPVMFKNITSYLDECRCLCLYVRCVRVCASVYVSLPLS